MGADQSPIAVIQVKVTRQLLRRQFSIEAAVPVPLLFGQETDRHAPPLLGEAFAKLTSSARRLR
jgi:hypothetical protein